MTILGMKKLFAVYRERSQEGKYTFCNLSFVMYLSDCLSDQSTFKGTIGYTLLLQDKTRLFYETIPSSNLPGAVGQLIASLWGSMRLCVSNEMKVLSFSQINLVGCIDTLRCATKEN